MTVNQANMRKGGAKWNAVVERDGAEVCAYCGGTDRLRLDHKLPPSRGGTDDLGNLQMLCADCNSHKGNRTEEEASKHVQHASSVAQAGFTMIPNAVLLNGNLSLGARMLYGVLKSYAWQSDEVWPGQERLAAELGISVRSFRDYGRELVRAELVRVRRRGRGLTNIYVILEPSANSAAGGVQSDRQETTHLDRQETPPEVDELEAEDLSVEPDGSTALSLREPDEPQNAQTLVAEFVDSAADHDLPVSRRVIGQVAKYVGELLAEGHAYERVRAGLTLMLERGQVKPALLGNFMLEAALPERSPPTRRYGYGVRDDELAALEERLREEGR